MPSTSSCKRLLPLRQASRRPFRRPRYISRTLRHVVCICPGQLQLISYGGWDWVVIKTELDEKCRFRGAERLSKDPRNAAQGSGQTVQARELLIWP